MKLLCDYHPFPIVSLLHSCSSCHAIKTKTTGALHSIATLREWIDFQFSAYNKRNIYSMKLNFSECTNLVKLLRNSIKVNIYFICHNILSHCYTVSKSFNSKTTKLIVTSSLFYISCHIRCVTPFYSGKREFNLQFQFRTLLHLFGGRGGELAIS